MKNFAQFVEMHSLYLNPADRKPPSGKYRIILYALLHELMSGPDPWLTKDSLGYISPTTNVPLMVKAKEFLDKHPDIKAIDFYKHFLVPNTDLFLKKALPVEDPDWARQDNPPPPMGWSEKDANAKTEPAHKRSI